jgi:hypothetical protein
MKRRRPIKATRRSLGTILTIEGARQSSSHIPRAEVEATYLTRFGGAGGRR